MPSETSPASDGDLSVEQQKKLQAGAAAALAAEPETQPKG
jgi:hypothetical protein